MVQKRSIFEEVGGGAKSAETPRPGVIDRTRGGRGSIVGWLVALFVLVLAMIFIGGLTRLTDSGLSITEWKPLSGALPPLSADAWRLSFSAIRRFRNINCKTAA